MMLYERYKDSGLEWLRQIPASWTITHLKRDLKKLTDGAHTSPDLSSDDYPFLSVVNLKGEELSFDGCLYTSKSDYENLIRNGCRPKVGDVLFSKDGTIGEVTEIKKDIEFVVGSSFIIITPNPKKLNSTFLKFYLKSPFVNDLARASVKGTGLPRLSIFNFGRIPGLVPPLHKQKAIAQYLDTKTQAIDKKVTLLEQKIGYYKELRKSLINDAVTKGLDKTVALKDSEIDWVGRIPEHWEVQRFKDSFDLKTGNSISDKGAFEVNENAHFYVSTKDIDIYSGTINYDNGIYVPKDDKTFKRAKSHSTLICIEGANAGKKIGFTEKEICFVNKLCSIKGKKKNVYDKYNYYFMNSKGFDNQFSSLISGLIGGVSINQIKFFSVLMPPIEEQTAIAEYLDQKSETIDKIVKNILEQIDHLKELRKTLINDVVTGKIKVVT